MEWIYRASLAEQYGLTTTVTETAEMTETLTSVEVSG